MSENIPFSGKALLVLLMSAFFAKSQRFLAKVVLLLKAIVLELCERFFSFVFSFCKNDSISFTDYGSEIRLSDCPKLTVN